jgi:hypothetical protein
MDDKQEIPAADKEKCNILISKNGKFCINGRGNSDNDYICDKIQFLPGGFVRLFDPYLKMTVYPKDTSKGEGRGEFAEQECYGERVDLIIPGEDIGWINDMHMENASNWMKIKERDARIKAQEVYDAAYVEFCALKAKSKWMRFWRYKFNPIDKGWHGLFEEESRGY